jgi:GTP cyclohydrolase I
MGNDGQVTVIPPITEVSIEDVHEQALNLAMRWKVANVTDVYGVPHGGYVPAAIVAGTLGVPLVDEPRRRTLIVDDLVDSGATMRRLVDDHPECWADALYRKPHSPTGFAPKAKQVSGWLVFPWEQIQAVAGPEDAVVRLLEFIGEDPGRPGLTDTPGRVIRSFAEMTAGYGVDVAELLSRTFDDRCDEMVLVRDIDFTSLCEHHLLPFTGVASVGYVPGERVVGLSKIARLVDVYARRLQVQERMTVEIAAALDLHLSPRGVGVVVRARHSCMGCRGVRKPSAEMVTSALLGVFRDKPEARSEFLALAGVAS